MSSCQIRKCCRPGTFGRATGPSCSLFSCSPAPDPVCKPCPAGTFKKEHLWLSECQNTCPPGSTSHQGSKSLFDCRCDEEAGYVGPDGGPCERTRHGIRASGNGTVWVFGADNFTEQALLLDLPVVPWYVQRPLRVLCR